jgi:hypothetical protein
LYWRPDGDRPLVSNRGNEPEDAPPQHHHDDPLLEAQEHKGYGEDEGERDEALDDDPDE